MIALAIAALALAGASMGGFIYTVKSLIDTFKKHTSVLTQKYLVENDLNDERRRHDETKRYISDLDTTIVDLRAALERETNARRMAEKHREELLDDLAKSGDPRAVASGVRNELRKLSEMSEARSAAPASSGHEAGAVHGSAAEAAARRDP